MISLGAEREEPLLFTREAARPVANPSEAAIVRGLAKLDRVGKSSYATVTAPDGSYVQTAGGNLTCLLERHSAEGQHFRANHASPRVSFPDGTVFSFRAGNIPLMHDEWFLIEEVTEAFVAFLTGQPFPSSIRWRNVTDVIGLGPSS